MSFSTKEYFVKETYKSIRRNGFMSFASISTVAVSLLVLGMFLLIFLNTNHLAQQLESQVQISVYMQDSVSSTQEAMERENGGTQVQGDNKCLKRPPAWLCQRCGVRPRQRQRAGPGGAGAFSLFRTLRQQVFLQLHPFLDVL